MDKGGHIFPKDTNPKENIIVWIEFELAFYDVKIQYISHHDTRTPSQPLLGYSILIFDSFVNIWS